MNTELYQIPLKKIDGQDATLEEYSGQVLLLVNVASQCGLTPQYEGLEVLYQQYKEQGLIVIGLPSNDFAGQEPGTEAEIQSFCANNYAVQFPMYSKMNVNSAPRHPLYKQLITAIPKTQMVIGGKLMKKLAEKNLLPKVESDVKWNFEKFLVARDGSVIGRFAPDVTPDDKVLIKAIEQALAS